MKIKIGSAAKAVGNTALSFLIASAAQAAAQALADLAAKKLAKRAKPDA